MTSLLADIGLEVTVEVITDSSAAKGTASRIGIGKIKHLDVGCLLIQEIAKRGKIILKKINGKVNPADLLTKPKSAAEAVRLTEQVGYGLVMRENVKNETFTGFVKRIMRGDFDDPQDQDITREWWYENMSSKWYDR